MRYADRPNRLAGDLHRYQLHAQTGGLAAGEEPQLRIELRCSPYHQDSALYPVIDSLGRALDFRPADGPAERLAALLSLPHPGDYPELTYTPELQRPKTMEGIVAWLAGQARPQRREDEHRRRLDRLPLHARTRRADCPAGLPLPVVW